jgi:hypothetical protein
MPPWRAVAIARGVAFTLKRRDPVLLLAAGGVREQLQVFGFDVAAPIGVLDGGVEGSERKALFDVAFR